MSQDRWKPRTLIVQHEAATPPGLITDWLDEQSAEVDVLRIDEEKREADPRDYELIVSLGSEFAAYDESIPFVERETTMFRRAVDADVPILGVCFGGQLLAHVLGGRAFRGKQSEVGWLPVRTRDPELLTEGPWFQWHFDSFSLPPGARLIAESDAGPQAFIIGRNLGLQFHPEVTPEIMETWVRVYPHELEAEGVDPEGLLAETQRRAAESHRAAWRLLEGFREKVAGQGVKVHGH